LFADYLRLHLQSIAVGLAATFLMIYGNSINGFFRKQTKSLHFIARFCLFILLCTVGYGFLTSQAVKILREFLRNLNDLYLTLSVIGSFVVLGFMARAGKDV
jgi:hypothetical protein